ncbi:hypothetical protein Z051_11165 [Rhodococcus rhodochrous KG-21]|uniref:Uncharacterized protein n=1 Tax=Rhodococcus rhodochrous KG-21 TaxID=1441923 RepID=A0A0M9WNZ6_RHORH|nr:hypothetical protein Z051_11165 [Rhodococcus rhodochrous KG-21]
MMAAANEIPKVLGRLPSSVVTKHLGRGIQTGDETPPTATLLKSAVSMDETEARWRVGPVRDLLVEAMERFEEKPAGADGWLAPRLHATLRMSRSEAADDQLWNHLAFIVAPDYAVWRHKSAGLVQPARFTGPHYTQAFSRLWWAAEMFRNSDDYRPVEVACSVQDVLNTTMRLDVIDHRPTAQAILRVLGNLIADGTPRLGDQVNALSSAINAAGSTLLYDVLAPDALIDDEATMEWIADSQDVAPVLWEILPDGPSDGRIPESSIETLVPMFEQMLAEAPKRKRSRHSSAEDIDPV